MSAEDRRQFRRTRLRLRLARLEGAGASSQADELWTANVSAGGMFVSAALAEIPPLGAPVSFELVVPPGEGYWASSGKVSGSGKVVRALPAEREGTGLAVQFTRPLALDFWNHDAS